MPRIIHLSPNYLPKGCSNCAAPHAQQCRCSERGWVLSFCEPCAWILALDLTHGRSADTSLSSVLLATEGPRRKQLFSSVRLPWVKEERVARVFVSGACGIDLEEVLRPLLGVTWAS